MGQQEALDIARRYAGEVARQVNPQQVILFGSHALDVARDDSDIDIAVVFSGFEGDFWQTSALLWKLTRGISTTVEPILLDTKNDPSGFPAEVMRTGRVLFDSARN